MKAVLIALFALVSLTSSRPQLDEHLCKAGETVIYSFRLAKSGRTASLCCGKGGSYLVYRFGSKEKIELEYPQKLDASSWKAFHLRGAKRFGGMANDAFVDYRMLFAIHGVKYELFESTGEEDGSKETGIKVTVNGKQTILKGDFSSRSGTLLKLDEYGKKIRNEETE